jgi:hypothetical protein
MFPTLMTNMSAAQCSTHGLTENRQRPQPYVRSIPDWTYYWRLLEALSVPKSAFRVSPFCPERFVQRVCCLLQVHPFTPPHQSRAASHPSERTEPSQKGRAKVVSVCASRFSEPTGQCRMEAAFSVILEDFDACPRSFWLRLAPPDVIAPKRVSTLNGVTVPIVIGHMYRAEQCPPPRSRTDLALTRA